MKTSEVEFDSGGTRCVATVYAPDAQEAHRPCVILCPGFTGTQDTPSIVATATAFAGAGYLAMTFDYRGFGLSEGEPRQIVDIVGQLADIRTAIWFARRHPGVDPERVALWGTSLGGGHVVTVAADEPALAAVVAQIPFNGFPKESTGRSTKGTLAVLWAAVRDRLHGVLGRPPHYIPAVGTHGELAVMASDEAERTIKAMESGTWENRVAPRALLDMMRYKPGDHAGRLRMPLLVCIAEYDRETVGIDTEALARRAPHSELRTYPCAHFEFYRTDIREQVTADQLAFLARVLQPS